ncbi:MAG: S-layer protein [Parcubacteria group bacterium]|nr:S-layer protein [Parcubacteria group bacterium]
MSRGVPTWAYVLLAAGLLIATIHVYQDLFAPLTLQITVLDVGEKSSATILRLPSRQVVLIDTGKDASILRALGTTLPEWQRSIDAVVLTSNKKPYAGGLTDVTARYRIRHIYASSTDLVFSGVVRLSIDSPGTYTLSYNKASVSFSSTSPHGEYVSDGQVFINK